LEVVKEENIWAIPKFTPSFNSPQLQQINPTCIPPSRKLVQFDFVNPTIDVQDKLLKHLAFQVILHQ
jgi:hypothetical protein